MARFIVVIRRPGDPVCYYLSKSGLRCYTWKYVWVARSVGEAVEQRDHFRRQMPDFLLDVEQLPPRVRLSKAVLRSVHVECSVTRRGR